MSAPRVSIAHLSPAPRQARRRKEAAPAPAHHAAWANPPDPSPYPESELAARETEAGFRHWLQELLTAGGWRWSYIPDSRRMQGHRGVPDILAVRDRRLVFLEVKTERGKLSDDQADWMVALSLSRSVQSFVVRPRDRAWIEQVLR